MKLFITLFDWKEQQQIQNNDILLIKISLIYICVNILLPFFSTFQLFFKVKQVKGVTAIYLFIHLYIRNSK